jgi:hypothetical protein
MGGGGYKHKPKHGQRVKQSDQWHEPPKPRSLYEDDEARSIGEALQAIVQNDRHWESKAPGYDALLVLVNEGVHGKETATRCIELIDAGMAGLAAALAPLDSFPDGKQWLDENVREPLARIRESKQNSIQDEQTELARQRVRLEDPGAERPHERATVLRDVIGILKVDLEEAVRLEEEAIKDGAREIWESINKEQRDKLKRWGVGCLADIQGPLMVFDSLLKLTDEEFLEHIKHPESLIQGIATYTELVGAVVEFVGSATITVTAIVGHVLRAAGETAMADTVLVATRFATLELSQVLTVVELVHGVIVLIDSHASVEERVDAGLDIGMSYSWLVEAPGVALLFVAAKTLLAIASLAGESRTGLQSAGMRAAFDTIQANGNALANDGEYLARAETLMNAETDAAKKAGLGAVREECLQAVKTRVLQIAEAAAVTDDDQQPGGYPVLVELFAPVARAAQSMGTPVEIEAAAKVALDRTIYAVQHHHDLVVAAAANASLDEMQQEIAATEAEQKAEEDERAQHDSDTAERDRKMRENSQWDRHH